MDNKNGFCPVQYTQQASASTGISSTTTAVKFIWQTTVQQQSLIHSELQTSSDRSDVLNIVTDAVKLWKSEQSGRYQPHKSAELSQSRRSCVRHSTPVTFHENRCITYVIAVTSRLLHSTLLTLFQLFGLPVLVGGCSTRSRLEQKKLAPSQKFVELDDCTEVYWGYCRNGGICKMTTDISQRAVPVCSCPAGFRGRQCELINDPNIYFSRQQGQMEMAAMSGLVVAVVFAIVFASFVLYLYRRYMKYGIRGSNSLSTFDTLELSSPKQRKFRNPNRIINHLEKNEVLESGVDPSIHVHLAAKIDNASSVFETFTLADHTNNESSQFRNTPNAIKKIRNIPRRTKTSASVTSEI